MKLKNFEINNCEKVGNLTLQLSNHEISEINENLEDIAFIEFKNISKKKEDNIYNKNSIKENTKESVVENGNKHENGNLEEIDIIKIGKFY